jgi:hypothetical protein
MRYLPRLSTRFLETLITTTDALMVRRLAVAVLEQRVRLVEHDKALQEALGCVAEAELRTRDTHRQLSKAHAMLRAEDLTPP